MRMYLLDKKQRVRRWLKDNDFIEAEMTEEINAANQINFSMPLKDRIADNIYYVAIPTPRSKQKYLLFKLLSKRVQNDRIEYQGIEEAYDELKQYGYIKDIRPNDRTAEEMLKMVLEPTRWTLGNVPETTHQSTNFYYITYLEALQKIVGLFNIELTFEVTIDPKSNKITRRQVNVYTEQGQRTGKRFEYGSNLLTVQQEQDRQELITALVGRGKGELVSEGHDDTPDGYGRRITFADVVWTKKDGHPVDKPAGQEYLVDPEATALYGFSDGNPRIGLTVFEDIEDPVELINATWRALQSLKRPKVSFKADVTDVGQLGLGDTVAIIRHDLKIEYFTRVYKVKHNLLNENDNQIELGDDFSSHSITSSLIKVDEIANEARETAGHAAIAANGKNNNYYSSVQPLAPVEGDIWYKDLGNGETDMYQYHNGGWVFIQSTRDLHVVENQVKEAKQGLNQAKVDIINNKQKADADIENLNKSIEVNKKVADESLQKLNDSVTNLQGQYDNNVVPNLDKVMANASDALQKYISAQNSIADLTKQAQEQGKDIADVTNTVKGLNINYANLAGDVNSTKVDVKGLQTTIGTANGDIAQLKLDAQNLQTMLAGKVDNSTYANFVNLTNQALNARLTASDLNGYAKTADVQATANGLRVDLNSVTDRMNNLKTSTRNLLFNTEDFQNYGVNGNAKIENISTLTSVPNHPEIIKIAHGWGDYQSAYSDQYVTLEKDKIYWFGFYVCTDNTTQSPYNTMAVYANENNSVANAKCWAYVNTQDYSYYGGKAQNWTWHIYKIIGDGKTYHYWRAEPSNHVQSSYYATGYTLVQSDIAPTEHVNSPEDTKNSLEQLSARIMTNSQQFSSYYTKSETDTKTNAAKNDAVNAIKSDSNWTGLKNVLTNSGFLQTADGFLQKVQQTTIPMFNGGGINLVQGTSNRWSDSWWNGFNGGTNQTKEVGKFYLSSLNVGDWVTVVVNYQYQNISGTNPSIILQADGDKTGWDYEIFPGRSWQKLQTSPNLNFGIFKWSFQINENALKNTYLNLNFRVDNAKDGWIQWCNLKIEKGKIATPWSPAPNDLATQSAFSELSQSLEGLRSTVGSNYSNLQTQISQSASGIRTDLTNKITGLQTQLTTTANGLNAKIGAIQVGGRNLLHGTSDSWKSFTVSGWGLFSSASSTNTSTDGYKKGDQFTYSATIDNNGSHPVSLEAVAFDGNNNGSYSNSELIPAGSKNYRVKVTFAIQENTKYIRTSVMFPNASGANDTIRIKDEQLEEGNLCTQWTPNPDDISNQFTELNATINGLQSTVSTNYGNLQSWIDQTAKAIRGEVTDKVGDLQTQITQQANNFNISLQHASRGGGINLALNTSDHWSDSWWNGFNGGGNQTKVITQIKFKNLNAGDWVTGSVNYQYQGLSGNNMTINVQGFGNKTAWNGDTFGAPNSQKLSASSNTQWGKFQFSFQVTANMLDQSKNDYYNVQFRVDNAKGGWIQWCYVKFEAGTTATPWSPAPEDQVAKDQILAQINMSAGTTLIQNDKIYMDASSTIFSGNAFIPSAAITSLNADKITAGTLNAANVNIINLNANNITTGTINGQNLKIDLNTGNVEFQHGRIHNFSNTVDINLDQNYISTANYNTRALLKDGELQLTQPNLYDTNGNWYFRLYNGGGAGDAWAGASLIGRDSVIVANEANAQGATGFTSNPMGTATFSGLFTGKGTNSWMPTILGGAERGVFIKGGNQMSIKQNIMDPNDGGVFATGSPFISVGVDGPNNNWWGNRIVIDGEYLHVPTAWRHTTGGAPNLVVASDGALVRSTSASKYKTEIHRDYSTDYGDRLLELPTATWIDKGQKKRYQAGQRSIKPNKYFGMIAEDLADAGLDLFVSRNPQTHEIEGIQYERIAPALIPVIRKLKKKVQELEEKLNEQ